MPDNEKFSSVLKELGAQKALLATYNGQFEKGHYDFLKELKAKSFSTNAAFAGLTQKANLESGQLNDALGYQQRADPEGAKNYLAGLDNCKTKEPFKGVLDWAEGRISELQNAYGSVQSLFENCGYAEALIKCNDALNKCGAAYSGKSKFIAFKEQIEVASTALTNAILAWNRGGFDEVAALAPIYQTSRCFQGVITNVQNEKAIFDRLAALRTPESWQQLNLQWNSLSPTLQQKTNFATFNYWLTQNDPIKELERRFQIIRAKFKQVPKGSIKDESGRPVQEETDRFGSEPRWRAEYKYLKNGFETRKQMTPERADLFKDLLRAMDSFYFG